MQKNKEKPGKTCSLHSLMVESGVMCDNLQQITANILKRIDTEAKNVKAFLLSLIWQLDNYERSYMDKCYYPSLKMDTKFRYEVKFAGFDVTFFGFCPHESNQEDYVMYMFTRRLKGTLKNVLDKLGDNKFIKDAVNYEWDVAKAS